MSEHNTSSMPKHPKQSEHIVTLKVISNYAKSNLEGHAQTYLNQEIIYGWPQVRCGKVVAVSDPTGIWNAYNGEIIDESKIDGNNCNFAAEFGSNVERIKTRYAVYNERLDNTFKK